MPEFDDLREKLRRARSNREIAADNLSASRERLKQVTRRQADVDRVFNERDGVLRQERATLAETSRRLEAEVERDRQAQVNAKAVEAGLTGLFAQFSDPRTGIANLRDHTPILLMPVRLETRFKTVADDDRPARQLWVRVYPDDCWIDAFHPGLTETEVADARIYWIGIWKAGGVEDQERGAWRGLAGTHGSGRAAWIVAQYQPANVGAKPVKPRPQDVILTIATETPPAAAEEPAVMTFWRDAWLADDDRVKTDAARAALVAAVGAPRAAEIVAQYEPVNFASPLATGVTKSQVNVTVAVVVFAPAPPRQSAWSHAPRLTILPDRFVFIGYRGEEPPVVVLGNPVPATLTAGPDPSAAEADQLKHDANGDLTMPADMQWITDFEQAVAVGMAFRIPLTPAQAAGGFDRVVVVGLRLSGDDQASKLELETLFRHHAFSRPGLAVVPQGTPTNNTEAVGAGFDRLDDPDESFADAKQPLFTPDASWLDKRDGQWVAEYLGIDPALFVQQHGAGATDQAVARAMHEALWPATLGYWMETMMAPVFTRSAIEQTREFFSRYVVAGGAIPAIRIGAQPYGILPATKLSRMGWLDQRFGDHLGTAALLREPPMLPYLRRLHALLRQIEVDWDATANDVSFVGRADGDPHRMLLDIVGLHPGSVEWSHRYAENLQTVFNRLNLRGLGGFIERILLALQRAAARLKLQQLGSTAGPPMILDKIFSGKHHPLRGGVVDDRPLSETEGVHAYTPGGLNYIQWLIDAANVSLDALYKQDGFNDDTPPTALLYLLLRHALQLGYHDVSVSLHEAAGLYSAEAARTARSDDPFLHVREGTPASESRYQPLYAVSQAITGSPTQPLHRFIATGIGTLGLASRLRDQLRALERLKREPTARLERAFADHADCCAYRLDAWMLGIVNVQLALMRNLADGQAAPPRQGIYLGAYGWLEDLRPESTRLTPVEPRDPDARKDFVRPTDPPLMRDPTNQGYIHTPSLNHAVAAAVLRNGFISNASPENRKTMAVNLTSERVRTGLGLLEGIRAGQGLADLLGYQFERGLHDRHTLAEVDKFIYKLRKAFPLRADHLKSTKTDEGVSIESIEARNVIDGLALAEHIKATTNTSYPFGRTGLPAATADEVTAINAEADRLVEAHDAVADLALAEGVYQAVLGNYDRVASTYDAYARGNFPPEPDVVRTPQRGIGLTHRVGLHLAASADPAVSPIPGLAMTPRAQAEPAVNRWLASVLPPLDQVACTVTFRTAATGATDTEPVTLRQLGLQPADVVAILQEGNQQAMSELDDRIVRHAVVNFGPRPDVPIAIAYMNRPGAPYSVFELLPLVRHVRRLITRSRPLRATDMTLSNEAQSKQDSTRTYDRGRLDLVDTAMQVLRTDAAALAAQLNGPLSDLDNRRGEILTDVDAYVADVTALLVRAAAFALPQTGWGFAYDFRRRTFTALLDQAAGLVTRWDKKSVEFTARLNEEAALPGTATDAERFFILQNAERTISTTPTPLPATPGAFRTHLVNVVEPAFAAKRGDFVNLANTTRVQASLLLADVKGLLPVTAFDTEAYDVTPAENEMVSFAQDAVRVLNFLVREIGRRHDAAQAQFLEYDAAASADTRIAALEQAAKALLGEDCLIVPQFTFATGQADEIDNALNASRSGALLQFLTAAPAPGMPPLEDFPIDTWLYGVARVRDTMHAWEQTMMFAGSLGRPEPQLEPLQLPFAPGDRWLGLEFPPDAKLDRDHLLYTAHWSAGFAKAAPQCGLLLDEWTETIPGSDIDTGIAFHHDRPNCEAPQAMLLVTPSEFRGAWQWNDLVDALNETLAFAKRRAIEPHHIDRTPYAPFLPATIMAVQAAQLTIAANLALNNRVAQAMQRA